MPHSTGKDTNPIPMMLGVATGVTFGPALAVRIVGTGGAPHGRTADAVAGTLVGWAATLVVTPLVSKIPLPNSHAEALKPLSYVAAFALPASAPPRLRPLAPLTGRLRIRRVSC